jgi:uncharacterized membrane protein (DUF4010 family)
MSIVLEGPKGENRAAMDALIAFVPRPAAEIALVLFLSFLIGLEREEQKVVSEQYRFGGVRTFPLLGLLGYALGLLSEVNLALLAVGFAVVGAFLWQSYRHKLEGVAQAGMTSEISGLVTFSIGALVSHQQYWIATTLGVLSVGLLELKSALESLARRVPGEEILTFAKFLMLTVVILPMVPNRTTSSFGFNPFKTWLIVAVVSAISYGSYLLQLWARERGGVLLAAFLGGAYSSTLTTIVLAKRSADEEHPHLYSGAVLVASGVMYLRLLALIAFFNRELLRRVEWPFLLLAVVAIAAGCFWMRIPDGGESKAERNTPPKNPLELGAAFCFAALFVGMLFLTHFALLYLGRAGLYSLAALMGVTDVDPFILSLTESSAGFTPVALAGGAIVIAAASNNLVKGVYAYFLGERNAGRQGLALLAGLAFLGLLPLLF